MPAHTRPNAPRWSARAFVAKSTLELPPTTFLTNAFAKLARLAHPSEHGRPRLPLNAPRASARSSPIMMFARILLFALLALAFGYAVFLSNGHSSAWWDLGFVGFSVAFLISFVHLIWRQAEGEVGRQRMAEEEVDPAARGK